MPPRTPRHLAEHRLPWRLMLVAFGLTFAVLAALVASAALVPKAPLAPSAVQQLPAETTSPPLPADPPLGGPLQRRPRVVVHQHHAPRSRLPGSPIALAAQAPTTDDPRATTRADPAQAHRPAGHPRPRRPSLRRHHRARAGPGQLGRPTTTVEPNHHGRADHDHRRADHHHNGRARPDHHRRGDHDHASCW